jgi:competence ComEA-like helix-hairpin-helix protein
MIEKLSRKIGFTLTEFYVIIFLAGLFVLGFIYKELIKDDGSAEYKQMDYSEQDSLFDYYSNPDAEFDDVQSTGSTFIKRKVLELPESSFYAEKDVSTLNERSININTAGIDELSMLPGIGEKTAEKIMLLRHERGKFKRLEELMDVQGIGEVKFNKIKKFLYIE